MFIQDVQCYTNKYFLLCDVMSYIYCMMMNYELVFTTLPTPFIGVEAGLSQNHSAMALKSLSD